MSTKETNKSLAIQFAELLRQIPDDIIEGVLKSVEDEDVKEVIKVYSVSLKNQFSSISTIIIDNISKTSKESVRASEELLQVTSGIELCVQVRVLCSNLSSNTTRIGLVGLIQMIKKIIKWILPLIFKRLPPWINELIDLIDEIINEILGAGSPKLANILSQKEQNYLSELAHLAVLKREEKYLFEGSDDEDFN